MLYLENAPLWVVSKSLTQCKRNKLNPIIQSWKNIQYVPMSKYPNNFQSFRRFYRMGYWTELISFTLCILGDLKENILMGC